MLDTLALSLALLTPGAAAAGPCDLLTREAASGLLGQPFATPTPNGPEPDEDTGGTRTGCVYQAGTRMLIVSRVAFPNAAAARQAITRALVNEGFGEGKDDVTIKEESGLGEKAFWAYNPRAAEYVVVKGATALALILGGMPKEPSMYQAPLRAATVTAAARL